MSTPFAAAPSISDTVMRRVASYMNGHRYPTMEMFITHFNNQRVDILEQAAELDEIINRMHAAETLAAMNQRPTTPVGYPTAHNYYPVGTRENPVDLTNDECDAIGCLHPYEQELDRIDVNMDLFETASIDSYPGTDVE